MVSVNPYKHTTISTKTLGFFFFPSYMFDQRWLPLLFIVHSLFRKSKQKDLMKRILLVIPSATYRTRDFMTAAQRIDAQVVVASDHRQAMADLVPGSSLALNFRKPESIPPKVRAFAAGTPFQRVIGVDDRSVYIAALIAETLNIPYIPVASAMAARNKHLMRLRLQAAGMPQPQFRQVLLKKVSRRFAAGLDYPCVLKPTFLSASRGVTRVDRPQELLDALAAIRGILDHEDVRERAYGEERNHVLVEDYIPGVEVALEGIIIDGELKSLAIFDKPDPLEGPHFVETIYITPSRLPGYVQLELRAAAAQAAAAMGIDNGPVHAEMRINEQGVWVVEIAARSIGGLCSRALRFRDDLRLEDLILRHALGSDIRSVQRERSAAAVMMIPIPFAGTLVGLSGLDAAREIPGIEEITISIPDGQPVLPMPAGGKYLGFIFARGDTPEDVEAAIRAAYATLKIHIETT